MNPLPSDLKKEIKDIPRSTVGNVSMSRSGMPAGKSVEMYKKSLEKWGNFLEKNFETGVVDPKTEDVIKPGTSLLLLRNQALKKGVNWMDFKNLVNDLRSSGKIELDPIQLNDLSLISQEPSKSLSVGEFIFGVKE